MSNRSESEVEASTWQFVPLAKYEPPAQPVELRVKKGVSLFQRIFRREEEPFTSPLEKEVGLEKLPVWQLERIAPQPDWEEAAAGFDEVIQHWLDHVFDGEPVLVLVGQPHSGYRQILQAWARKKGWPVLGAPPAEQILLGEVNWLDRLTELDHWVFPALERAYLRHTAGMDLVRNFLDQAVSGYLGRGVIGCDSWAWAFLRHVWHGRPPLAITHQAWDETRLSMFFHRLACGAGRELLFRQSDDGSYVLSPPEPVSGKSSRLLKFLAAHSRGNLGVALAFWRNGLKAVPDETLDEQVKEEDRQIPFETVWVTPWEERQQLALPTSTGHEEAFVLHALLLHAGLPYDLLCKVLPVSSNPLMQTLSILERSGFVARQEEIWQVTPEALPGARQYLQDQGYFVDVF